MEDAHNPGPRKVVTVVMDARIDSVLVRLKELEDVAAAPAIAAASFCAASCQNFPPLGAGMIVGPCEYRVHLPCAVVSASGILRA